MVSLGSISELAALSAQTEQFPKQTCATESANDEHQADAHDEDLDWHLLEGSEERVSYQCGSDHAVDDAIGSAELRI